MKTIVLITSACLVCFTAFAQGHAQFGNDTTRLVYYHNVPGHPDGDPVWAGNSTIGGQTYNFMADLYMGTSSDVLSLISSATFSTLSPGRWNALNVITPFPFGSALFTVVQVRDASQTPPNIWTPLTVLSGPYGRSDEFHLTLDNSLIIYVPIYTQQGPNGGSSDWAPGTYNMDSTQLGDRGAIPVTIPEPSSFALILLFVGTLRLLRSRTP